jgi:uncharacterized protein YkwD
MIRALAAWFFVFSLGIAREGAASLMAAGSPMPSSTAEEKLVVVEMSKVRLHPKEYAQWLRTQAAYFEGRLWRRPERVPLRTQEGVAALDELISFLEHTPSPGPLRWSEGLSRAARQFVQEQGPTGQTGHVGPVGSTMQARILAWGLYQSTIGEVIQYGAENPRWTVVQLLIDDGVPSRGHRTAIFEPSLHVAGAATGPHAHYDQMTVVDLADSFQENPESPRTPE